MNKKKLAALLLCGLLPLSVTGCALTAAPQGSVTSSTTSQSENSVAPVESAVPQNTPEAPVSSAAQPSASSETSEGTKDPNHPENTGTQSGELPIIEGDPAFVAAFSTNAVDFSYLDAINKAGAVSEMTQAANAATAAWETQINYGFTKLTEALEGDAKTAAELEQSAWSNELSLAKNEISANAGEGSTAQVDVAYKIMLLYRSRAVAIFGQLYVATGVVEFHQSTGEAVG